MHQFREGCRERQRTARRGSAVWDICPRHERYLLPAARDHGRQVHQQDAAGGTAARDANPRLVGEQVDSFRELYLWRARREARAAIRAGRTS